MKKRNIIIIISIIVIGLVIVSLYSTFAASNTVSSNNTYTITLSGESGQVVVPAGTSKTVIYQITNTNKGVVQYGVAYSGNNIEVKVYSNSQDEVTGGIDYGETKFVKLYITNNGTTSSTANIKAVLGYEKGGTLDKPNILPSGHDLVTEIYSGPVNLLEHITNLYTSGNPTQITQGTSGDKYYYSYQDEDNTWGLMNDGLKVSSTLGSGATAITDSTKLRNGTEGNIRYFGANPDNYIYFNCSDYSNQSSSTCEIWRIIGIVDGKVKIIRNEPIGNLAWDQDKNQDSSLTTYNNNWETSSLQLLLNGKYYNRGTISSLTYYSGETGTETTNLNLANIGIKNDATRGLISNSTWYLGGYNTPEGLYPNDIYTYERTNTVGTTIYSGNPFTINANIGLMYPSDYGYAADLTSCSSNLYYYNDYSTCIRKNWMYNPVTSNGIKNSWLLTPYLGNGIVWRVFSSGDVSSYGSAYHDSDVSPVLYLNPSVVTASGDGSEGNPYRIDINGSWW